MAEFVNSSKSRNSEGSDYAQSVKDVCNRHGLDYDSAKKVMQIGDQLFNTIASGAAFPTPTVIAAVARVYAVCADRTAISATSADVAKAADDLMIRRKMWLLKQTRKVEKVAEDNKIQAMNLAQLQFDPLPWASDETVAKWFDTQLEIGLRSRDELTREYSERMKANRSISLTHEASQVPELYISFARKWNHAVEIEWFVTNQSQWVNEFLQDSGSKAVPDEF